MATRPIEEEHFQLECSGGELCYLYDPEVDNAWWDHVHETEIARSIINHQDICKYTMRVIRLDHLKETIRHVTDHRR